MSAQTVTATTQLDLAGYLAAVRRELGDLGQDEVDELTGGLEADLADALAGSGATPVEVFGPPAEYAAELRNAAGLPPRAVAGPPRRRWRRADAETWLAAQAWWPAVREFLVAARPVWWAFRALVVYQILAQLFTDARQLAPTSGGGLIILLVLVVLSIEAGRRDWAGDNRFRRSVVGAVDLVAVVSLLIAAWSLLIQSSSQLGPLPVRQFETVSDTAAASSAPGASFDAGVLLNAGDPVTNIFPYDAEGNLLQGVQLYDQKGNRIEPSDHSYEDENFDEVDLVPAVGSDGEPRYNVFPLKERLVGSDGTGSTGVRDAKAPARSQYPVIVPPASAATVEGAPAGDSTANPAAPEKATPAATVTATPAAPAEDGK